MFNAFELLMMLSLFLVDYNVILKHFFLLIT